MTASGTPPGSNFIPLMRYRDLATAIDWLQSAFGFERRSGVTDARGVVFYAEMAFGNSIVILSSIGDSDLDQLMAQPDELGGVETRNCYVVIEDADAHYTRALANGAIVVLDLQSDTAGRRGYSCRDLEGHIWSFGTYNPGQTVRPALGNAAGSRTVSRYTATAAGLALAGTLGWFAKDMMTTPAVLSGKIATANETRNMPVPQTTEPAIFARRQADIERNRRVLAEAAAEKARSELQSERAARTKVETTALKLREDLEAERIARSAAVDAANAANNQMPASQATPGAADAGATSTGNPETGTAKIETSAIPATANAKSAEPVVGSDKKQSARPRNTGRTKASSASQTGKANAPWPYSDWSN